MSPYTRETLSGVTPKHSIPIRNRILHNKGVEPI